MPEPSAQTSPQAYARMAGLLYLIIIVFGLWSQLFVRAGLIAPGDAAAMAENILQSEGLFRLAFAADTVMALSDVALAVLLYVLLAPVSRPLALMAAAFRLVQTAILGANLLNHHTALLILEGAGQLPAFDADQRSALALLLLEAQSHGYDLALLFFGLGSLILGYLIFKAAYFPRLLGVLLAAAGLVYLAGGYLLFLAPALADLFAPAYLVPIAAEASFCLWLLVKGVDVERWRQAAAESDSARA